MPLLLAITFLLVVVAGRIIMQYKLTGDHGIRLASIQGPLTESIPGSVFVFTFVASTALTVLNAAGHFPVEWQLPALLQQFGAITGFTGIVIASIAQQQMRESWRIGVDPAEATPLVTLGLYARSRNPIYFGILLYWVGLAICFAHPAMWILAISSWLSIEMVVRKIEEPYLFRIHGEQYTEYHQRTHRYLPLSR